MRLNHILPSVSLTCHSIYSLSHAEQDANVSLDSPAQTLFTDFYKTPAITVQSSTQIDVALEHMMRSGVRVLFVIDENTNIIGLVTTFDILGEKPILHLQRAHDGQFNAYKRSQISVQDIMEPLSELNMISMKELDQAKVADIAEIFKHSTQRHMIVLESTATSACKIMRGLFSAAHIESAVGISLEFSDPLSNFSDIEYALLH